MKLINIETQDVVVEFKGEETIIYDSFMKAELKRYGIIIPVSYRSFFQVKSMILLGQKSFQKAFKEIYCPRILNKEKYEWRE